MVRLLKTGERRILDGLQSTLLFQTVSGSLDASLQRRQAQAASPIASISSVPTAVSGCHLNGSFLYCKDGITEYLVHTSGTGVTNIIPTSLTNCHAHDGKITCHEPNGNELQISLATQDAEAASGRKQNCHFHAGVEHCSESTEEDLAHSCAKVDRDYNIPLRVGLLFAILVASTIGVLLPILAATLVPPENFGFTLLRQFGTGIIVSTAFVHLFTHASLMFANECIGHLAYEPTAAAILVAGLCISFLVEYFGQRLAQWHRAKSACTSSGNAEALVAGQQQQQNRTGLVGIAVMESGIIFHSLLIGLTLIVSGDTFFITLAIVIAIHQLFEGLALGTRIATLGQHPPAQLTGHSHNHGTIQVQQTKSAPPASPANNHNNDVQNPPVQGQTTTIPMSHKLALAGAFALVTPMGMAIGLGVLKQFNGNSPSTIIAIGTLDALSAGILVWVSLVEMWAPDWMLGGEMTHAGVLRTTLGLVALAGGMALMSFLGKWA
ncbi:hypothetical protein B0T22DRAFT_372396 [Podospora appendiculata]|uniref:Zinc transporter n=1 Tax=Podospora appendiculata TaxID=314037 RepID=A0AAE0XHD0_9PEZI|nr:hypothetical protein B0T22DRAFT_372396 [Podospora appendiculata]